MSSTPKDEKLANIMAVLPRAEKISVKELLTRDAEPTFGPFYWSQEPGKIINKLTGQIFANGIFSETNKIPADYEWLMTLHETIVDAANVVHRKSLRSPANIVVASPTVQNLVCRIESFRPSKSDEEKNSVFAVVPFIDAKYEGTLSNRYYVFSSKKLQENQLLVALQCNGTKYTILDEAYNNGMPVVNIKPIDLKVDPCKVGDIEWWGFVEVLDLKGK